MGQRTWPHMRTAWNTPTLSVIHECLMDSEGLQWFQCTHSYWMMCRFWWGFRALERHFTGGKVNLWNWSTSAHFHTNWQVGMCKSLEVGMWKLVGASTLCVWHPFFKCVITVLGSSESISWTVFPVTSWKHFSFIDQVACIFSSDRAVHSTVIKNIL